jgi:GMP synthase (glutamine-hydrolysing)
MKSAFVVRHVAFEDLGTFAAVLDCQGYRVVWHEAGQRPLIGRDAVGADLLIVLGGPIGVYDDADYPCVADAIDVVRRRLTADAPTLGICLGSQIMAAALGARVYPGSAGKEIGWGPIGLTDIGAAGPLVEIGSANTAVLHWHGDTFDLPNRAQLLASTQRYAHQAFSVGRRGLALQFHPEVTAAGLESWFIGHTGEIRSTPGISVAQLRADTARHAPTLGERGPRFFARWLSEVML